MEFTNDEYLNVKYNSKKDILELKKIGRVTRLSNLIKRHKFITIVLLLLITAININIIYLIKFVNMLYLL